MTSLRMEDGDRNFTRTVEERSGQKVSRCYQCGACTGRCPAAFAHDVPVNRIMRLIQLGRTREVLGCKAIWLCAACRACTVQCPNALDVARIMETCRQLSEEAGQEGVPAVKIFAGQFLDSIKKYGRVFEPGLMLGYMLRTGRLLTDVDLAPAMLTKGKLPMRPHRAGNGELEKIFRRFEALRRKRAASGKNYG